MRLLWILFEVEPGERETIVARAYSWGATQTPRGHAQQGRRSEAGRPFFVLAGSRRGWGWGGVAPVSNAPGLSSRKPAGFVVCQTDMLSCSLSCRGVRGPLNGFRHDRDETTADGEATGPETEASLVLKQAS